MNNKSRYPKIAIRSKRELAKRLSNKEYSVDSMMTLINDVIKNYSKYWADNLKQSQPIKNKWVRDASRTKLGVLLERINAKVLRPYDDLIPSFVFGGVSGRSTKMAVESLLGKRLKRKRILLKLDISRFFEQIKYERVYKFFLDKGECEYRGAKLLADLCCVPIGPKDNPGSYKTIGRGFSTSSRLAVWCNIDTFIKLERLVKKELQGKDPCIAIYVDDIGITAKTTKEDMVKLYPKIKEILTGDIKQRLPLNDAKSKIVYHSGEEYSVKGDYIRRRSYEHLGLQMKVNSVCIGSKTRWKLVDLASQYKNSHRKNSAIRKKRVSTLRYKRYIEG